jgi:hypothetical protein
MNSFRGLDAWKKAMDLVDAVYDATRSFPRSEIYGLSSQLKKAAISIPSDIAEGRGLIRCPTTGIFFTKPAEERKKARRRLRSRFGRGSSTLNRVND